MANRYATKTGSWSDVTVWDGGTTLPTSADDVYANGFTVTINTSPTVLSIRTQSASGINAGGGFQITANGITLGAAIIAGTTTCLTVFVSSGQSTVINGNVTGGTGANAYGLYFNSAGNITINGNISGGSGSTAIGVFNNASGTINIAGNATGGSNTASIAVYVASSGPVNITGSIAGGSGNTADGFRNFATATCSITGDVVGGSSTNYGVNNAGIGIVNITGNVTGGTAAASHGAYNGSTGTIAITGNATGSNTVDAYGVRNNSTGTVTITGTAFASNTSGGARNASAGVLRVTIANGNGWGFQVPGLVSQQWAVYSDNRDSLTYVERLVFGSLGNIPTAGITILTPNANNSVTFYKEGGGTKTLVDGASSSLVPAASNVRSGITYAAGSLTGTCAVPAAGSVAFGVPVDNTTGTAVLTADSVRSAVGLASANLDAQLDALPTAAEAASAVRTELATELGRLDAAISTRLAPSGTLARVTLADTVTTLTNAPDVPTEAEIATAVRTELSTELGRIDASTSSRLAAVAYTAPPSVGDIAAAVWAAATRTLTTAFDSSTTIAAAVWSAATRTLTSSTAPSAADNAAAVWGYSSGRTVTGGTVDTVTNSTPVDAGEIADAVRTELTPELARLSNAATTQEVGDIVEGALND